MRKVVIGGTGMTRFGKFLDSSLRALAAEAAAAALSDAETGADEVGMVFFGNAAGGLLSAQECVRGQVALRQAGLQGKPIVNVENACASSSTAFHLAVLAVGSGQCDVALAVGAEKMSNEDKTVPLKALEAAADRDEFEELKARIAPGGAGTGSVFMDLYSSLARDYAARTGATPADYARVSVKQRRAGARNARAQFQEEVSVDDVLGSRMIAEPLTLMMCSPIGDGAAALVLMSEDYAARKAVQPVAVLASELRSGRGDDAEAPPAAEVAARPPTRAQGRARGDQRRRDPRRRRARRVHALGAIGFLPAGRCGGPLEGGRHRLGRAHADQPERRAHQQGPSHRRDRRGPARGARRPAARPLRRPPARGRALRPRRERGRLDRRRRGRRLRHHPRFIDGTRRRPGRRDCAARERRAQRSSGASARHPRGCVI